MKESALLLIHKAVLYFSKPFASWHAFGRAVFDPFIALGNFSVAHSWLYLLSSFVVAWLVFLKAPESERAGGFLEFAFPSKTYRHRSAIADFKFVAFDLTTRSLLVSPVIGGVSWALYLALKSVIPAFAIPPGSSPVVRGVVASIAALLISDLGLFLAHYLQHRIRFLWIFHEVHHSAEVMTPVTVYRVHPVDYLMSGLLGAVTGALITVFYSAALGEDAHFMDVYGVNAVLMVFFMLGFHLRHSHVWLSFGPIGNRIFMSPAQHQIHHSLDRKHFDKNFGYTFAFWDWLFGTLYVPQRREKIEFGIPHYDFADYATVKGFYLNPFWKAFGLVERKPHD